MGRSSFSLRILSSIRPVAACLRRSCWRRMGDSRQERLSSAPTYGYTTARYRIPTSQTRDWKAVVHLPNAPGTSRGSLLYPLEGNDGSSRSGGEATRNRLVTKRACCNGFVSCARPRFTTPSPAPIASARLFATASRKAYAASFQRRSPSPCQSAYCRSQTPFASSFRSTARGSALRLRRQFS